MARLFARKGLHVGVERAVTRWYVLRQALNYEISLLEARLEQAMHMEERSEEVVEGEQPTTFELQEQLARAQKKLDALGPCPRPMMG